MNTFQSQNSNLKQLCNIEIVEYFFANSLFKTSRAVMENLFHICHPYKCLDSGKVKLYNDYIFINTWWKDDLNVERFANNLEFSNLVLSMSRWLKSLKLTNAHKFFQKILSKRGMNQIYVYLSFFPSSTYNLKILGSNFYERNNTNSCERRSHWETFF